MKTDAGTRGCLLLMCCLYAMAATAADTTIMGTVRNRTTGQLSAGDNVLLLRAGAGQQEVARTSTDAQGAFSLNVASLDGQFMVRVSHQGVGYDQAVSGKGPFEINVFDAVAKIRGLKGNMGIAQVEAEGETLKVTEMYSIRNLSNPPVTQSGPRSFDISLPANANLDSLQIKSGGGDWIKLPPAHLQGQKSHYSLDLPLRPGDTLFKFSYHLPNEGHTALHIKLAYPIERFAVIHPPSMMFKGTRPGAFKAPGSADGMQIEEAATSPVVGEAPSFEVSGTGTLPQPAPVVRPTPPVATAPLSATKEPPRQPATNPPAGAQPAGKALWPLIAGAVAVLALVVLVVSRSRAKSVASMDTGRGRAQLPLHEQLKEELFRLEADRLNGSISEKKYASARKALEESIQRSAAGKGQ
ncbi:MAG TPA: hypothetical protein VNW97_07500 [Candidatus Saccharimonadales bacterium]|jgi:hypothetical protein|nr:hypothetical protein [Candidatus Saccharimonadales bacterium]